MKTFGNKIKRMLHKSSAQREMEYRLRHGLTVGENTHIYSIEGIDGAWPWLIKIGNNVTISSGVTILAHDASTNVVRCGTKLGRVIIGDNVFIGARSVVLCNTKIGDNVIVGAGSVVTGDLLANGVYAGVPAKYICSIDEYQEKYFEQFKVRPHFDQIYHWDKWPDASQEEHERMFEELEDGIGFV